MKIFENIINHKINNITADELLKYGNQFQISITKQQAAKIADYLKGKNINIFNDAERTKIVKEIARIAGPDTAKQVNQLFIQLTK
ncbi:DUF2624 domain-containing protein [Bacillus sp. S/N-304-OC-R1]|uniref:DUF2624 domain-containing protein n=1 Tax=Bacillus sp. S/N-304-OC-R1 TaxID=2758034 RepID=UPI001C8E8FFB|nr:DUF2624 domain-containing protein [Bacillus sp. S/N-304-OC-R1]MBY0122364.1 DUF2624 domain-containing protein [Bacillus sp. S/N-304-OC-R1]